MRIKSFFEQGRVLSLNKTMSPDDILQEVSRSIVSGVECSESQVLEAFLAREKLGSTVTQEGAAFPHAVTSAMPTTVLAVAKLSKRPDTAQESDWRGVKFLFALAGPESERWEHLRVFARLYRFCRTPFFLNKLAEANSDEELRALLIDEDGRHV